MSEPFLVIEGMLQRDGLATSVLGRNAWPLAMAEPLPDVARNFY